MITQGRIIKSLLSLSLCVASSALTLPLAAEMFRCEMRPVTYQTPTMNGCGFKVDADRKRTFSMRRDKNSKVVYEDNKNPGQCWMFLNKLTTPAAIEHFNQSAEFKFGTFLKSVADGGGFGFIDQRVVVTLNTESKPPINLVSVQKDGKPAKRLGPLPELFWGKKSFEGAHNFESTGPKYLLKITTQAQNGLRHKFEIRKSGESRWNILGSFGRLGIRGVCAKK